MVPALYWPLLGSMYRGLKEHLKKNPGLIEVTSKYRTRTGLSLYIELQLDVVNKGFRGGCDDLHGDILLPMPDIRLLLSLSLFWRDEGAHFSPQICKGDSL